jgi:hypothetical protein
VGNGCVDYCDLTNIYIGIDGKIHFRDQKGRICIPPEDRFIVMFSTGIKKKYAIEVFESDICNAMLSTGDVQKGIITFYALSWCFDISKFYPLAREGWCENLSQVKIVKIIGNKYQNPELLKENK